MPGIHSIRAFHPQSPAIREMADVCADESDYGQRRADANETLIVAGALQAAAMGALRRQYPGVRYQQLASQQEGLTAGTESYNWSEYDVAGMAKIISNYADDLPDVSDYAFSNTGQIRSLGAAFQYSKQDVRAVIEARRLGRQTVVLDVDKVSLAREIIERKKDEIAAIGSPLGKLPGILKSPNVTLLSASAPATGTSKKWTGPDKTGEEMLADLRALIAQVPAQSMGIHEVTTVVTPIEEYQALAGTVLMVGGTEMTVLSQFALTQQAQQRPVNFVQWNRARFADAAGSGPRIMAYENLPDNARIVEPLDFEADPPQRVALTFRVPCEARFGGIYIRRPLAFAYMDFI